LTLELESDENELTLHRLLDITPSQPAHGVVDQLRRENSSHEKIILEYMRSHKITV